VKTYAHADADAITCKYADILLKVESGRCCFVLEQSIASG